MRIGIERNIRDRITTGGEVAMVFEVPFHDLQRLVALLHPLLDRMHLQLTSALDEGEPEMGGADIGLEAVLLEEHPLQRLRAIDAILRRERGADGEVP